MNFKEKINQAKTWVKENKGKVILGASLVVATVIGAVVLTRPKAEDEPELEDILELEEETEDYGRELEMQFVVPETGEILGKVECYETFMNDMLECQEDEA